MAKRLVTTVSLHFPLSLFACQTFMRTHFLQDIALRYFFEVAQCGSLSEASHRLHVAASALSRQITALEAQMGQALFERHPRGMVLTPAGEILASHVRRIQLDAERTLSDIEALQGQYAGRVRIATSDAFANELIPKLCVEFQRSYSGIGFQVHCVPTGQVSETVRSGEADIGLCFNLTPQKQLRVVHRQSAPVMAMLPPGHPLAAYPCLTLAQLNLYALALPKKETAIRQVLDNVCAQQGIQLAPVMESNHSRTLQHFVMQGGGVSVTSEISSRSLIASGVLVVRPLSEAGLDARDVEVQVHRGRQLPPATQAFLDLLKLRLPSTPV